MVSVFGGMAETVMKYLKTGSKVLVKGQLRTRRWEEGEKKYATNIVVSGRTASAG
ncbi:MAG: single-stranded DNA-binding protein [Alphaproteobacteria bacterium]|nr:single-stranded DNA-binding protein [Alphaproteobacteria bacterium]